MRDLEKLYDSAFFSEWGRGNAAYVASAEIVARALFDAFRPATVADLGCGCGVYGHWFSSWGARVLSIDGVRPPAEAAFDVPIEVRDLTKPFDNAWGPFDLAICLEVAEHVPPAEADALLDNLVKFADVLALSAAPPGQGGHHHVNEQPKRYWVEKLAARGFVYDRAATGRLIERLKSDKPPHMWMGQHIAIYRKASADFPLRKDLPFKSRLDRR